MNNNEIIGHVFGGLLGTIIYVAFMIVFIRAAWKGDLILRFGRIRGKLARVIGVIGLIGMAAGTYLIGSLKIFDKTPPFATIAGLLLLLLFVTLFVVNLLSLFMWHEK